MIYLYEYIDNNMILARDMLDAGRSGEYLSGRYSGSHEVNSDKALFAYAMQIKNRHLRNATQLDKVRYDSNIQLVKRALGLNTTISRVQGIKLKSKNEIRIAMLFKSLPPEFLRMIVVHELAHLREKNHTKAFYSLCLNMEPNYYQYEFDLRLYLAHVEVTGKPLWV